MAAAAAVAAAAARVFTRTHARARYRKMLARALFLGAKRARQRVEPTRVCCVFVRGINDGGDGE